jgi:hypothetical protein
VAQGLYGLGRTSLASPLTPDVGPLGTLIPLGTLFPLARLDVSTQTTYNISDDVFKRILTWDIYKGDGKRFSSHWLKRRIMRFLVGVNGTDPQPWYPGFVVGAENTSAIGVQVSGTTLTVTISQGVLQLLTPLTPGILNFFQLAFEAGCIGGVLDLPIDYTTYVCNIILPIAAIAVPSSLLNSSPSPNQVSLPTTVEVSLGSGSFSYAWTWESGGAGITITDPTSATTTFSVSGATIGTTYEEQALCTVTDLITLETATAVCSVTFNVDEFALLTPPNGNWLLTQGGQIILLG